MDNFNLKEINSHKFIGALNVHAPRNDSADGRMEIPIGVIGKGTGPTILVVGGVHGDEPIGPVTLTKLFKELKGETVEGRVLIVPTINPTALYNNLRFAPEDNKNMNRCFGINNPSSLTERICNEIGKSVLPLADVIIDVHSGGRSIKYIPGALLPLSGIADVDMASWKLAEAFNANFTFLSMPSNKRPSHLTAMAHDQGKPSIATEIKGSELASFAAVNQAISGLKRILSQVGLIESDACNGTKTKALLMVDTIRSPYDGLYIPTQQLGYTGSPGEEVGQIMQSHDLEKQTDILAFQRSSILIAYRNLSVCKRGDLLFQFGMDGQHIVDSKFVLQDDMAA